VLFPHGRVSDVQRRMMTTAADDNVHALAIEGTFDDCQAIVKGFSTTTPSRPGRAVGRQFDQLGAHSGASRLLLYGSSRARRSASQGRFHCADR